MKTREAKLEGATSAVEAKPEPDWRQEAVRFADIIARWRADEPIYRQKLLVIEGNFTKIAMGGGDPVAEAQKLKKESADRTEEARQADQRARSLIKEEVEKFQSRGGLVADYVERRQRAREILAIFIEALAPIGEMAKADQSETAALNKFIDDLHGKIAGPALQRATPRGISLPSVNLMEFARRDDLLGLLRQLHNNLR